MAAGMKRIDLQRIAQAKLDDAALLLSHGRFANAYYLAGYAVEIGLKACIAKQISRETIPDKAFVNAIYTHGLKALVGVAGLSTELRREEGQSSKFAANWGLVANWTPEIRYDDVDRYTAQITIDAISDGKDGVLRWIKVYW
jgi:HEPN domain-containing protein